MENKKWPVLASIFIALGVVSSLGGIFFSSGDILSIVSSIAGLVIFWSVYKFKGWALMGLTIFLSIKILLTILLIFGGMPIVSGIFSIVFTILIIFYFNSPQIKALFK